MASAATLSPTREVAAAQLPSQQQTSLTSITLQRAASSMMTRSSSVGRFPESNTQGVLRGISVIAQTKLGLTANSDIETVSISEDFNGQILVSGCNRDGGTFGAGRLPTMLNRHMRNRDRRLPRVTYVSVGPTEEFYVAFADGTSCFWHHDTSFVGRMSIIDPKTIRCVCFGTDGAWIVITTQYNYWSNIHSPVLESLLWSTRPTFRRYRVPIRTPLSQGNSNCFPLVNGPRPDFGPRASDLMSTTTTERRNMFSMHNSSSDSDSDNDSRDERSGISRSRGLGINSVANHSRSASFASSVAGNRTNSPTPAMQSPTLIIHPPAPELAQNTLAGSRNGSPGKPGALSPTYTVHASDGGRRNLIRFVSISPLNPDSFVVLYDDPVAADWCVFDDDLEVVLKSELRGRSQAEINSVKGLFFGPDNTLVSFHRVPRPSSPFSLGATPGEATLFFPNTTSSPPGTGGGDSGSSSPTASAPQEPTSATMPRTPNSSLSSPTGPNSPNGVTPSAASQRPSGAVNGARPRRLLELTTVSQVKRRQTLQQLNSGGGPVSSNQSFSSLASSQTGPAAGTSTRSFASPPGSGPSSPASTTNRVRSSLDATSAAAPLPAAATLPPIAPPGPLPSNYYRMPEVLGYTIPPPPPAPPQATANAPAVPSNRASPTPAVGAEARTMDVEAKSAKDYSKLFQLLRSSLRVLDGSTTSQNSLNAEGNYQRNGQITSTIKSLLELGMPVSWFRSQSLPTWLHPRLATAIQKARENLPLQACRLLVAADRRKKGTGAAQNGTLTIDELFEQAEIDTQQATVEYVQLKTGCEKDAKINAMQDLVRRRIALQTIDRKKRGISSGSSVRRRLAADSANLPRERTVLFSSDDSGSLSREGSVALGGRQSTTSTNRENSSIVVYNRENTSLLFQTDSVVTGLAPPPLARQQTDTFTQDYSSGTQPSTLISDSTIISNSSALIPAQQVAFEPPPQRGVLSFANGFVNYLGHVRDGKRHGWGVSSYGAAAEFSWFAGHWENDVPVLGLLCFKNGIIYFGEVDSFGRRQGFGSCNYLNHTDSTQDRAFLAGRWAANNPQWGVLAYRDGRHYTGAFLGPFRNGPGCCFFPPNHQSIVFCGQYDNDQYAAAPGVLRNANGMVLEGDLRNNQVRAIQGPKEIPREPTAFEAGQLEQLLQRALRFVAEQWPESDGRVLVDGICNWRRTRGPIAKSVCNFLRGVDHLSMTATFHSGPLLFGWHGTSHPEHLWEIEKSGFNPSKRSRQNQGPGEYFAVHYQDAVKYCQGKDTILLSAILPGFHVSCLPDSCYVVNNPPAPSALTFVLPIVAVQFVPPPVRRYISPSEQNTYRWQFLWQGYIRAPNSAPGTRPEESWIPHEFAANRVIALAWNAYLVKEGPPNVRFTITPLDVTEIEQEYEIDFLSMTQKNVRSDFTRKITYAHVPAVPLELSDRLLQVFRRL
jgi:hypothetical protein